VQVVASMREKPIRNLRLGFRRVLLAESKHKPARDNTRPSATRIDAYADPRKRTQKPKSKDQPAPLKGWQHIAAFLGQPVSVAQRWAKTGMPVTRQGRLVVASPEELNKWLGRESGEPVHVATEETDLSSELKRGLAYVRGGKHPAHADRRVHEIDRHRYVSELLANNVSSCCWVQA
jgi:hypothetical protein